MKKILLLFLIAFMGNRAVAQTNNGWEEWQKTSCYNKISFRLKEEGKQGDQYVWKIQFKSEYNQLISFNYHITDKVGQYTTTTHRKNLTPNQVSPEIEIFTDVEDIYILVDKVSLSAYPGQFENCDH